MTMAPPPPASRPISAHAVRFNLQSVVAMPTDVAADVKGAVRQAAEALFRKQRDTHWSKPGEGPHGVHWCAELEGDSILSSEYILMKFILGQERGPGEWERLSRIANQMRLCQRPDGSWGQYPGAPADISACVKAYLSLKLMGDSVDAPHMVRAREVIRRNGGAEACNTFSTFYLACLGVVTWNACPAIPPQIVLLPRWFPFHMKKVAAWTRTMILPLALCSALQPVRTLDIDIDELFLDLSAKNRLNKPWDASNTVCWRNFFLLADRVMKVCRRVGFTPFRKRSIRLAEQWIARRMSPQTTEGLGAIFPPMVYVQVAFKELGYTRDHPLIRQAEKDLDAFMIDEKSADPRRDHIRLQPCFSPVWDSAIALDALAEAGYTAATDPRMAAACDWLRAREVKLVGDWYENLRPEDRHLKPGVDMACWAFEYKNDWYPDVDDTVMVAKALTLAGDRPGETINRDTAKRAVRWVLAMQNDDGGWAAFDRTKDRPWMEAIPFADHNAMQDPSCSDITGRVMDALRSCGVPHDHECMTRGVEYLLRTQQPEGCWWGRWGSNYIYGTWQAVNGLIAGRSRLRADSLEGSVLRAAPSDPRIDPALDRARDWLLSHQNPDGGFGESANSYIDRSLMGIGPSTASQTAWALITLMNLLPIDHPAVQKAVKYLCGTQLIEDKVAFQKARTAATLDAGGATGARAADEDAHLTPIDPVTDYAGSWAEHWFTGTGFPKVFYLRYHSYRHSFPLKALSRYLKIRDGATAV
jgi:squalene-hopene/tetraprenyl-beta-curcumene cyclase